MPLQEVGWFDREENASGALSSRLSADTAAIRGALGDQIGLLVQNLVTFAGASPPHPLVTVLLSDIVPPQCM